MYIYKTLEHTQMFPIIKYHILMHLLGWEGIRFIGILQAACLNGFSCICGVGI